MKEDFEITRRSLLLLGMSHIFILILTACTQATVADGLGDQTAPSSDSVRDALQESIDLAVPGTNGASELSAQESLSTVNGQSFDTFSGTDCDQGQSHGYV